MNDPKQEISEEIRKREKMMADRMAAYHRSMEKFASNGNPDDQEDANRSIKVWLKLKDEVTELKKYLSELE
jgi:DnaJ-domain-containing protein 1